MTDIHAILKRYWGYDSFRPQQQEIIESVLRGEDTLALLPTGGGKSICYQVPAIAREGICIVVSPLIALMKDQVENLKQRGIGALLIYSGMQRKDIIRTLENARGDYFKFLYVSPERLETSLFHEYLPALNVNLIAVDEAHCIAQWGHDFRPSYLRISELRKELPDVPLLAVTASATEEVQKEICERLTSSLTPLHNGWRLFRQPFERKNLSFSCFHVDSKINKLIKIIRNVAGSGIVYCKSRKRTTEIANLLQMHRVAAAHYHAGLPQEERAKQQQAWIDNKIRVIVCTNAFGMGIDKSDVRFVVHVDVPDCLENYYQEAGRGGRDGQKAYAVLLYDDQDIKELAQLHTIRYPSFDEIKQVYTALVNFLQIPVHSGQEVSYSFRFDEFVRNFKLNVHQALYSLKALEQDGWIEYNEKSFIPSTVVFTTSKQMLNEFYKSHPAYEELCTALLRTYEGIFDFPAFISETLLASLLKKNADEIKQHLKSIASFGIIKYTPQNDLPQLVFKKNRVAADDLQMNLAFYETRKQKFIQRVQKIIEYTKISGCRSRYIAQYFGDKEAGACGVCDNCLRKKVEGLSEHEFREITAAITTHLSVHIYTAEELTAKVSYPKEKTWKVLQFLQKENRIITDPKGCLLLVP